VTGRKKATPFFTSTLITSTLVAAAVVSLFPLPSHGQVKTQNLVTDRVPKNHDGQEHVEEAQKPQALRIEDTLNGRRLGDLMSMGISPDNRWLAYGVTYKQDVGSFDLAAWAQTGVPISGKGTDIYVSDIQTGKSRNLTENKGDNWLPMRPAWSPDGHCLAFLSDRDGGGQARLWIWDATKDELRKVSDIDVRTEQIEWMPDSQEIMVTTVPGSLSIGDYVRKLSGVETAHNLAPGQASGSTVTLYEAAANSSGDKEAPKSDPWNLDRGLRDLAIVDVRTGKFKMIVRGQRITSYSLSPDGSHVAYTTPKRFEKPGSQQILFDLAIFDLRTMESRVVASNIRLDFDGTAFSWSPEGSYLSFHTGGTEERAYDCYVVNANGGAPRDVTLLSPQKQRSRYERSTPVWDMQRHIYFLHAGALWRTSLDGGKAVEVAEVPNRKVLRIVSQSGILLWESDGRKSTVVLTQDALAKQDGFYKINLATGESTKLLERGQCYTCGVLERPFAVTRDGQHVAFMAEDAQHDTDLWLSDPGFINLRRLTHLNPQFDKYNMGAARLIDWLSNDGERLRGVLLLPPDYQPGKRYPLVVWVYEGSSLSDRLSRFGLVNHGPFNMQLLATRGYAVLLPDAPQHLGTPMVDLAKTILPGVNEVIRMGIADPDQLGVMGHSYGGYSTMSLIVQAKRFKAAIEADGTADLFGDYGTMNVDGSAFGTAIQEHGQGLMGGTPWEVRERYIENSPIFFLDRVETPLLIVHGSKDTTVAPFLGDQIFVGLRRLGKGVEYAKYEGEGHSPLYWSYANQLDFCERMIAWFDDHLKKKENEPGADKQKPN